MLVQEGAAILQRWDLPLDGPWRTETLPDDAGYRTYRAAIRDAGAELARPIADPPVASTGEEREMWRREDVNAELAAPYIRPVHCLEAALFAYQHARYDQLGQPTEFVSVIVRDDTTLRVYFGASDQMFPPKRVYGIDEARRDVAAGWRYVAHLHNHTIRKRAGKHALGTPAPSGPDVHLLGGIEGLAAVWVTNGVYTADIPGRELARFQAR